MCPRLSGFKMLNIVQIFVYLVKTISSYYRPEKDFANKLVKMNEVFRKLAKYVWNKRHFMKYTETVMHNQDQCKSLVLGPSTS